MEFPALNSEHLSQAATDQASLGIIKALWDEHSDKLPDDIRQTILDNLEHVRSTRSNATQPSGHRIWKDPNWNFGTWVVMAGIYGIGRLTTMKQTLESRFPDIDFDSMDGPSPPPLAPPARTKQTAKFKKPRKKRRVNPATEDQSTAHTA
ncbi:hypothetical protein NCS52_00688300 [Fusarium sp. LHS14.1]|nr:hypothetical protein NCS52_00688300 [Fusarium sp. LHS14.1]